MDDAKALEVQDRLVLLLITQPAEGWEAEFDEIIRREIERLWLPEKKPADDDA